MSECICDVRYHVSFSIEDKDIDPSEMAQIFKAMFVANEDFRDVRVWAVLNKVSQEVVD